MKKHIKYEKDIISLLDLWKRARGDGGCRWVVGLEIGEIICTTLDIALILIKILTHYQISEFIA